MSRPTSLWRSGIDSARSWTVCLRRIQPRSRTRCHHHLQYCQHGQPQHPRLWPMVFQPPAREARQFPRGHETRFQFELPGDDHYSWSMVQPCPATEYPKRLSQLPPSAMNPIIPPMVRGHDARRSVGNRGHFGLQQSSSPYSLHSLRLRSDPLYRCRILGMKEAEERSTDLGWRQDINTFITSRVFSLAGCTKQQVRAQQESTLALMSFNSCIIHFYTLPFTKYHDRLQV